MVIKIRSYCILSLIVFISCGCASYRSSRTDIQTNEAEYLLKKICFNKFGVESILEFSPKKTYVLCLKKKDSDLNPMSITEFFVYNINSNSIVYEDLISGASLSWKSDFELWIKIQKGIITSPDDSGKDIYIYDLINKNKYIYNKKSAD